MARKASKIVLVMAEKRLSMLAHVNEMVNLIERNPENVVEWLRKDPIIYISRMEGYNIAFEDLLHVSKCYQGYNYLDKKLKPLIWHPQYEKIQDHPEFAEWRRVYYV